MENLRLKSGNGYLVSDFTNGVTFSEFLWNLKKANVIDSDITKKTEDIDLKIAIKIINDINGLDESNKTFNFHELENALAFSEYLLNLYKVGITDLNATVMLFKIINGYEVDINNK